MREKAGLADQIWVRRSENEGGTFVVHLKLNLETSEA